MSDKKRIHNDVFPDIDYSLTANQLRGAKNANPDGVVAVVEHPHVTKMMKSSFKALNAPKDFCKALTEWKTNYADARRHFSDIPASATVAFSYRMHTKRDEINNSMDTIS